jgi:hypothetical protein
MGATLTDEIAAAAARLVVDEGMDYDAAKRKAARSLGRHAPRQAVMPANEQVEAEVRSHLALFCADTQPAELRVLRELALGWMERLAEFRPHLAGAVWRGTATRLSAVHLDLYCDDAKAAEIALINRGMDYDVGSRTNARGQPVDVLTVASRCAAFNDWVSIHLTVRDHDDLRGALKADSQGRSWRGDTAALRRLLAEPDAAPA